MLFAGLRLLGNSPTFGKGTAKPFGGSTPLGSGGL